MITFWMLATGLCLLAACFVALPLYFNTKTALQSDRDAMNVSIFKERLAEYELALQTSELDQQEFEVLSTELKKNLLLEIDPTESDS